MMRSNPSSCRSCWSPWFQSSWETFPSQTPENPTKENHSSQLWKRCAHIFLKQLRSSRVTWNFWRERPLRVPRLHDFAWILVGSKGCLYETLEFRRGLSCFFDKQSEKIQNPYYVTLKRMGCWITIEFNWVIRLELFPRYIFHPLKNHSGFSPI